MPDHTSWFTYLLALPGFRGLWAVFNHLGCVNAEGQVTAMEAGGQCAPGYAVTELPNHFSYPANTPVTIEYTTLGLFVLLIVALFVMVTRARLSDLKTAKLPEGQLTVASFTENFVEVFYGLLKGVLGKDDAKAFLPIVGTSALFIFFSNALGLIPGFSPPTSNFNVTLACGLVIFFFTHWYGFKRQGGAYAKHFLGPVPALIPLMLPLELVSHLVRPLSLAIRLCVNLFVDHLVVSVFTALVFVLVPVPIMVLGVLVVVLQTYVFCLLSTIYFQLAIEHHDDHGEHGDHGHDGHDHAHA
ncbi:MAG: F0F1 ATP synthase subunit A [Myxococcales bacterium]|nr:F0F1 ATP synthase subunit A [Myxococcales bacterium]